jgi:hypothetical protein
MDAPYSVRPLGNPIRSNNSNSQFAKVGAGAAANFGSQRAMAWGVHRGADAPVESLNALNAGSYRKFETGPGFQPVEAR